MNSHVIWLILPIIRGKRINILIYRLILFRVRLVKLRKNRYYNDVFGTGIITTFIGSLFEFLKMYCKRE